MFDDNSDSDYGCCYPGSELDHVIMMIMKITMIIMIMMIIIMIVILTMMIAAQALNWKPHSDGWLGGLKMPGEDDDVENFV